MMAGQAAVNRSCLPKRREILLAVNLRTGHGWGIYFKERIRTGPTEVLQWAGWMISLAITAIWFAVSDQSLTQIFRAGYTGSYCLACFTTLAKLLKNLAKTSVDDDMKRP